MDTDEYARMAAAGERHWWYRATRQLLGELMAPHIDRSEAASGRVRFLDAAGGSGATGSWLAAIGSTANVDVDVDSLRHSLSAVPGYVAAAADLNHLPHPEATFDAVLCVTALCHKMNVDPAATVRELARVTRPGGVVCVMEPGVRRLRRGHDLVTHTARRFSRHDLAGLLDEAGLTVVRRTGAYLFLVPPAAVLAVVERGRATSDVGRQQGGLGGTLGVAAALERRLLRRFDLPTGLSVIAIAVKPTA